MTAPYADVHLQQLLFNLGKYLLISSSRPGAQPANLVGLWAEGLVSPWSGDYHININLQMMYWAAEALALPETVQPLVPWLHALTKTGENAAQCLYGAPGLSPTPLRHPTAPVAPRPTRVSRVQPQPSRAPPAQRAGAEGGRGGRAGWVAHGFTDLWMNARPLADSKWAYCVTCGAWVALHLWDAYRFSRDGSLLRRDALPILAGAVDFFLAYLTPLGPAGALVTGPSHSPENSFSVRGKTLHVAMGPAIDTAIVYEVLSAYLEGCHSSGCLDWTSPWNGHRDCTLARCAALAPRANETRGRLPNAGFPTVDAAGLLDEFYRGAPGMEHHAMPDYGHRHFSPLFPLFPGDQIQRHASPQLAEAAARLLHRKLADGGGHTGWSAAWAGALHARLGEGEGVQAMLDRLSSRFTLGNLLTTHPPLDAKGKDCATCVKEGVLPAGSSFWGETGGENKGNFIAKDQSKFQLDANLGMLAAVAEALLQSRDRICACDPLDAAPANSTAAAGAGAVGSGGMFTAGARRNRGRGYRPGDGRQGHWARVKARVRDVFHHPVAPAADPHAAPAAAGEPDGGNGAEAAGGGLPVAAPETTPAPAAAVAWAAGADPAGGAAATLQSGSGAAAELPASGAAASNPSSTGGVGAIGPEASGAGGRGNASVGVVGGARQPLLPVSGTRRRLLSDEWGEGEDQSEWGVGIPAGHQVGHGVGPTRGARGRWLRQVDAATGELPAPASATDRAAAGGAGISAHAALPLPLAGAAAAEPSSGSADRNHSASQEAPVVPPIAAALPPGAAAGVDEAGHDPLPHAPAGVASPPVPASHNRSHDVAGLYSLTGTQASAEHQARWINHQRKDEHRKNQHHHPQAPVGSSTPH